jgi:hypothetical protein
MIQSLPYSVLYKNSQTLLLYEYSTKTLWSNVMDEKQTMLFFYVSVVTESSNPYFQTEH